MATSAGVGLSLQTETVAAGQEAARMALEAAGTARADWGLVFATMPHRPAFAPMLAAIEKILGTSRICGCSGWGVLGAGSEVEGEPGVAVLAVHSDRIQADTHLEPSGEDFGRQAALSIGARVADERGLLLAFPDPFAVRPDLMLETLHEAAPDTQAVGAAAAGAPRVEGTYQFRGRNVATRSLAALHLSASFGITQGCQPLGPVFRVTACHENTVLQLDGRPALAVLQSILPAGLGQAIERLSGHLFVGLPPDPEQKLLEPGEYVVRPIVAVEPARQAILLGQEVSEGEPLLFVLREGQAARDDLKQMLGRMSEAADQERPSFGLYFNCAGRGASLYGLPGVDSAFLSRQFGTLPIIGFFGNAEIAPLRGVSRLFTYTGVLALVGEAAAP
jgi:small ligand-binding sensory domain FIST